MFPVRLNDRDRDRDRRKNSDSPASTSSPKPKHRHRSSYGPSRPSTKEHDRDAPTGRSSNPSNSTASSRKHRRSSMPGVDNIGRSGTESFLESRSSLPYPTFSKAHSKEAVGKPGIPTPDPTDLTEKNKENENGGHTRHSDNQHAPPSPPLTSVDQNSRKGSVVGEKDGKGKTEKSKDGKAKIRIRTEATRSSSSLRSKKDDASKSDKTVRPDTPSKSKRTSHHDKDSPARTASRNSMKSKIVVEEASPKRTGSRPTSGAGSPATVRDIGAESTNGSDATIGAQPRKPKSPELPPSRTRMRSSTSHRPDSRASVDVSFDYGRSPTANSAFDAPPPPPPPPEMPVSIPRVDYLLQNGGLDHKAPKALLGAVGVPETSPYQKLPPQYAASRVFDSFHRVLDDYNHVMTKNGSLAVATGYRSVARRLLDRLESVFARDISSESCRCLMCDQEELEERPPGVSWGEVLELVSGRRDLPSWPPFILAPSVGEAELSGDEYVPMQKMDIDVPEEYRDHYMRQSRKTKVAVDKWLNEQTSQPTNAPEGVDDETLTFAMLTHLGTDVRPLFRALLGINSTPSPTPQPDGQSRTRSPELVLSSLAIQRLYRLPAVPRDPETAIYMVNNPDMHHVLATLAAISDDEWEILISGRFDGFLRSGAEDNFPAPGTTPSRWSNSRSNTPFTTGGISRGTTPNHDDAFRPASQPNGMGQAASFGGPIALDEEMEIAALAEIERDIYLGMEALEDAFEALHHKAEVVRLALRERGTGLSVANQKRRGSYVEARLGTPSSALGQWDSEDDFLDDRSLAPDDSASNISSNRRRRPKRRTERRTPAPVEEEDEGEDIVVDSRRDRDSRGSRRR